MRGEVTLSGDVNMPGIMEESEKKSSTVSNGSKQGGESRKSKVITTKPTYMCRAWDVVLLLLG